MTGHPERITTDQVFKAMTDAGLFREDERIRRIVIDMNADYRHEVVMYVERYADARLLDVVLTLDGIEIRGTPAAAPGNVTAPK